MNLIFNGSFIELKKILSCLNGAWDVSHENKKVLTLHRGMMNWFESTGTITFQGKEPGKNQLERLVPKLLSATDDLIILGRKSNDVPLQDNSPPTMPEMQFLTTGINGSELVIGIVSSVGAESNHVTTPLRNRLEALKYKVVEIRVSELLNKLTNSQKTHPSEYERIKYYMDQGDELRKISKNNGILATGISKKICENRISLIEQGSKIAYIVNSLKHPKEVEYLRKIYSNGFYLIGIHADEDRRYRYLTSEKGCTSDQARLLIKTDENEHIDHGQKTRDTYHLSDFFINLGSNTDLIKNSLQRFLELIFSHPYKNPTFDEFAMFMAFNSSARSSDLSRQVGAIISRDKQIIATGANDVPQSGGGQYWAEVNPNNGEIIDLADGKDYKRSVDSNKQTQIQIIEEISNLLIENTLVASDNKLQIEKILKESRISDLTEFGRIVHAEMDALMSCSRAGISTLDTTLYCTTFPCHNCAKHIISGGIKRVVYVEPYPKSRALDFHSESIFPKTEFDNSTLVTNKVIFEPFIGVGPRRFLDLFSMNLGSGSKLKRKNNDGTTVKWSQDTATIRTPLLPKSYIEIENAAIAIWENIK